MFFKFIAFSMIARINTPAITCRIMPIPPLNDTPPSTHAEITVNSNLSVTCTNSTPYNVGLSAGTGTGSAGTTRYMSGTGANTGTVQYNLLQTTGGPQWGNTQGTDTVGGTGTGSAQTLVVHGAIPAQATPAPDSYKSTVTATVYF